MSSEPFNRWAEELPEVFDSGRAARLIARGDPPQSAGAPVVIVAQRALGRREQSASPGQFEADDRLMRLAVASPEQVAPGDLLLDDEEQRWTVIVVRPAPAGAAVAVIVRRLPSSEVAAAAVDLFRAEYAKAASGAATVAWALWRSGVAVTMQPLVRTVTQGDRAAAPRSADRWLVFFDRAVFDDLERIGLLDHRVRLRDAAGRWFGMVQVRDRARIDRPASVEVEAIA